ncbi:sensor histidine kinase [Paenibacillus faecalis]|uniref:sensor histidine kinase n=1 Tax=Paenibacillus faecalis TaxID=2079532 RepID=UPI000D0E8C27|nr:sensor histidine kinase [Paenibacillus faecalis]
MKNIKDIFRKSIRAKIFVSFIVVMVFTTLAVSLGNYYVFRHILNEKVSESVSNNLKYIANDIQGKLGKIEALADYVYTNYDIRRILTKSYENDSEFYMDSLKIDEILENYLINTDLSPYVSLIIVNGEWSSPFIYGPDAGRINEASIMPFRFDDALKQSNGQIIWHGIQKKDVILPTSQKYVISMSRVIKDLKYAKNIGTMLIYIDVDFFSDYFANTGKQTTFLIADQHKKLVFHTDPSLINTEYSIVEEIGESSTKNYFVKSDNGIKKLYTYSFVEKYNWWIVESLPLNTLFQDKTLILMTTAGIFMLSLLITGVIWYVILSNLVRPIKALTQVMNEVDDIHSLKKVDVTSVDEVGQLSEKYNYMIDKINELIHNLLEEQTRKKDAEYKALQAQINPHFLYNTLNTIRWMAIIQKNDSIKEVVEVMGRLLKNTFKSPESQIVIQDEIQLIQDYIYIQKLRYNDKFELIFDLEEQCLSYYCLKFMLQPIVENAIFHGIEPKEGQGTITIRLRQIEQHLIFEVMDDGIGMSEQQLDALLHGEHSKKERGIGLYNVNERIQLSYGKTYGVQIVSSQEPGFTCVTIKIPIIRGD